ncbi:MAG: YifB family Mg chelatase-like AAA ATPase [Clostridiales bacterium]|nr:YifB family Mg chelatase-like AAA ATPase [Candidatus Crickella equi]
MISKIKTAVCMGINGKMVNVETDISNGLPNMNIVGLASTMVMESKERIKSAIINSGYEYPRGRVTVNLTPADVRKTGSGLDLPIAIGLLAAGLYVNNAKAREYGIIGALSLDGEVLGVEGLLPMLLSIVEDGIKKAIIPIANYNEAKLVAGIQLIPVVSLEECVDIINDEIPIDGGSMQSIALEEPVNYESKDDVLDFSDIRGQEAAKRAITIAVAGRHGLLMVGSPGCGKTMLARRIPTIMPEMTNKELIETAIVYSIEGRNNRAGRISIERPFRSPHNSIGRAGLLGGGNNMPVPGEITLAHNGVLFLDEACEFERDKIESLRQPIEDKEITHVRAGVAYTFPCNFQLVMASNPCKCGYYGDSEHLCKCTQTQLEQYRRKLSGPMMDRIDLRIQMETVSYKEIAGEKLGSQSSAEMRKEVERGIEFANKMGRGVANGDMTDADLDEFCKLGKAEKVLMKNAYNSLGLSPRSYKKILKVARTIADMDESREIKEEHLAEALSYRMLTEINAAA